MAYERIKTVKGREYRYLVTGTRNGTKVVQKVLKYLGPVQRVNNVQRKKGGGPKPTVFARKITDAERSELQTASRSNDVFARERAKTILLSSEGKNTKDICSLIGKEKRSVLAAIHAFNEKGIACLAQVKRSGRKPVFTLCQRSYGQGSGSGR